MSLVHAFPVPEMVASDWGRIFVGLGVGIGLTFQILNFAAGDKNKSRVFTLTNFWLIMSGVIHVWIEYAFVFHRDTSSIKPGLDMYASADFRYGHYGNGLMESGTHAMEVITAVLTGPLCFLVAYAASMNYSWRYPLQLILCTMQLYGLTWFVLQPIYSDTGAAGHFSSDPFLFWVIAFGCNAPWGIFPVILLVDAFRKISAALSKITE